ncbi:MAG: hypothetical protein WEB00_05350 [Dehalococcoidia bacterium]
MREEAAVYGTMARMRVKDGKFDQLMAQSREDGQQIEGSDWHILRLDSDANEVILFVVFESKEAYRANANSPEQDARYRRMRELLEKDPEWHDGEIFAQT